MSDELDEFKQTFFIECAELLVDTEDRLMKLEPGVFDKDAMNAIFRCAHSIKGGSGAFSMNSIMNFTHVMETLLDSMREGKILPSVEIIDLLLKSIDIITRMLETCKTGSEPEAGFGGEILTGLKAVIDGKPIAGSAASAAPVAAAQTVSSQASSGGKDTYEIKFAPNENLFNSGNEPLLILREVAKLGETEVVANIANVPILDSLDTTHCYLSWNIKLVTEKAEAQIWEVFEFVRDLADITVTRIATVENKPAEVEVVSAVTAAAPKAATAAAAAPEAAKPSAASSSIRVDLDKIDKLVNMVGELVITEAMLKAQTRNFGSEEFSGLMRGIEELSHHTRELQEAVMSVRMQPVKSIFSRMPRIVRDTAASLGKDIQLVMSGENTEVDKTVIEQLSDPLMHMIRNSVDHGVESPEKRAESGKPLQGTIHLSAYHRSGRIIIEIQDDGAGINRERVLGKAKEKGLVAPDAVLTDEEIDHLIFAPGFSTAEKITNVSGRGVGMDVVRKNIEGIGGNVHITNMPGKGSIFRVSLPLTLAILDGMIVRVGREFYIIPITSIIETMQPKISEVHQLQGRGDVMNVRGEYIPLVYLHKVFGIKDAEQDPSRALTVLVEGANQKMGLIVDELIGQQQVVIKSLTSNSDPVKGISGATILGDGKVSLILEINELKQLCETTSATAEVELA